MSRERWRASFPASPTPHQVAVVLHRRHPHRIEVRRGTGSSTEAAVASALGRRVGFVTASDELAAVRAAFDGRPVRIEVADRHLSTFECLALARPR